jgi:hypothetical protein
MNIKPLRKVHRRGRKPLGADQGGSLDKDPDRRCSLSIPQPENQPPSAALRNPSIGPGTASLARVVAEICGGMKSEWAPLLNCDPRESRAADGSVAGVPASKASIKGRPLTWPFLSQGCFDPSNASAYDSSVYCSR